MFYSLAIERKVGTLTAVIFKHENTEDPGVEVHSIEGPNFTELMWAVSDAYMTGNKLIAVRHEGKLDFPDEISVGEAAECLFWDIIKGE